MSVKFRSDMVVELIDSMGGDHSVVRAARVSSGSVSVSSEKDQGLINYLMRDRHGSPRTVTTASSSAVKARNPLLPTPLAGALATKL